MKTMRSARFALCLLAALLLLSNVVHADIPTSGLEGSIINGPVSVFDGTWSNANIVGTLQTGDPVLVLQQSGPLFQVFSRINRLTGWVSSMNVQINQVVPAITPGVVISQNVTLRETPSTNARQLARPSNGAVLGILGEQGDWYHVRFYDASNTPLEGYVRTRFVVADPSFVTTTKSTFVYATPSRSSKMVADLISGTQLVVIGEFGDFWVVNLRSASGFIHKNDIEYGQMEGNG